MKVSNMRKDVRDVVAPPGEASTGEEGDGITHNSVNSGGGPGVHGDTGADADAMKVAGNGKALRACIVPHQGDEDGVGAVDNDPLRVLKDGAAGNSADGLSQFRVPLLHQGINEVGA